MVTAFPLAINERSRQAAILHRMNGEDIPGLPYRSGFMPQTIPNGGFVGVGAVASTINAALQRSELSESLRTDCEMVQRGEYGGDVNEVLMQLQRDVNGLQRGVTTTMANFPVRENLEAPAALLIPTETPLRNRLARVPGSGTAVQWRQLISLGGGWGTAYGQPGGQSAIRMFYPETGAPVEHTSIYANRMAAFKLMGSLGSISGFAQAAGRNFQDQLATERQNQLSNTMLNEELALIYGDSTSIAAPWGDGSIALAFDGIMTLISTANGTPSENIQVAVGALTTAHIDAQITRIWNNGGRNLWILMNAQEAQSFATLLQKSGSINRLQITDASNATMGFHVGRYLAPVTGEPVELMVDRFMLPGDMIFGCDKLPDGKNSLEVEVLPQVPVETAPEKPQQIQGYVATDLARTLSQPDMHPFMISVYEVLKMRSARHFAKSTGILPAA
jgi:hypothetical protein